MFLGLLAGGLILLGAALLFGVIVASLTFIYIVVPAVLVLGFLGLIVWEQFKVDFRRLAAKL